MWYNKDTKKRGVSNSMIIYRPHRGSLNDSLRESKVFDNYGELFKYIVMSWDNLFDTSDIRLLHIDNDTRIGWNNVFYVCTKRFGAEICSYPQCVGIMATHWTTRGEKEEGISDILKG